MKPENRRTFVKQTGAASLLAGSLVNLNPSAIGANDRVTLAFIGGQNRGRGLAKEAIEQGGRIKTFCDIDDAIIEKFCAEFSKQQNQPIGSTKDYQETLQDKDIDAVVFATPDHWHAIQAIQACQAGKDVYCEKPLSHTIHEGHLMRNAARKYNRVFQVGTQRRSMNHFRSAVEYAASGKLGVLCLIKTWMCQVRGSLGNPPDEAVPAGVDYDRWLGPAPQRPFNKLRFHYNWRFFWDYCNTELGNQGVHMLDIAMWVIEAMRGMDNALPTRVSGQSGIYWLDDCKEVPDTQTLTYDYGNMMLAWELRSFQSHHPVEQIGGGIGYYGSDATMIIGSRGWKVYSKDDGKVIESDEASGGSHMKNFFDCVKSRKRPNADVEIGRLSTTICHIGNICGRLGRDVVFDPKTETFGSDKEANKYLTKEYRAPYALPAL